MYAHMAENMPVLVSFAQKRTAVERSYMDTFSHLLLDSGAYSEHNSGVSIDIGAYVEWTKRWPWAVAWAGLDDINGDWRRSLKNYKAGGFPTLHDTDPPELLDELIPMARERGGWIGLGLKPPRHRKEAFLRSALDRMPADLHVHGWACGAYSHLQRFDSVDSFNWILDIPMILNHSNTKHLTPAEALEIIVKRYRRMGRRDDTDQSLPLFRRGQCS